ncbi:MAG: hypothetical protein Q7K57_01455 [Burkholderiaceae bacterium]|nr:hypothetical protein [Burkholderiaceae bacterium]
MAFQKGAKLQGREALWDDLNAWCLQRGVFLGGTPGYAFLLVTRKTPGLAGRLTSWLQRQTVLGGWKVKEAALEAIVSVQQVALDKCRAQRLSQTPADHDAQLEAVAQFQQYLVEQLQWTVLALHSLRRVPDRRTGRTENSVTQTGKTAATTAMSPNALQPPV